MSQELAARAEVAKLARLIGSEPDALGFLAGVDPGALAELRELVVARLFDTDADRFRALVGPSKVIPAPVIATITQRAFGPLLTARIAGAAPTHTAVEVGRRLSPAFLADVAVEIDPRRVPDVIAQLPRELIVEVAAELSRRGEHVAMGRFIAFIDSDTLAGALGAMDDETLLATGFVAEDPARLDGVVATLSGARVTALVRAASRQGMWAEGLAMLRHLGPEQQARMRDALLGLADDEIGAFGRSVQEHGEWELVVPLIEAAEPGQRDRLEALAAALDRAALQGLIDAAAGRGEVAAVAGAELARRR